MANFYSSTARTKKFSAERPRVDYSRDAERRVALEMRLKQKRWQKACATILKQKGIICVDASDDEEKPKKISPRELTEAIKNLRKTKTDNTQTSTTLPVIIDTDDTAIASPWPTSPRPTTRNLRNDVVSTTSTEATTEATSSRRQKSWLSKYLLFLTNIIASVSPSAASSLTALRPLAA